MLNNEMMLQAKVLRTSAYKYVFHHKKVILSFKLFINEIKLRKKNYGFLAFYEVITILATMNVME